MCLIIGQLNLDTKRFMVAASAIIFDKDRLDFVKDGKAISPAHFAQSLFTKHPKVDKKPTRLPFAFSVQEITQCQGLWPKVSPEKLFLKKQQLKTLIPAAIPYLNEAQKAYYQQLLQETIYLELLLYNFHLAKGECEAAQILPELARHVALSIAIENGDTPWQAKDGCHIDNWQPLAYLGFALAKEQVLAREKLTNQSIPGFLSFLGDVNYFRLYWIWTGGNGGLLDSLVDLPELVNALPDLDFNRYSQRLNMPSQTLGYFSWVLYYFRLGVNLFMLARNTVGIPLFSPLTKEEKAIPYRQRLQAEWEKRKYVILNDLIWGIVNHLCFFWLIGTPLLGSIGGLLNVGLMAFDFGMAWLDRQETYQAYMTHKQSLVCELESIKAKLAGPDLSFDKKQALLAKQQIKQDELVLLEKEYVTKNKKLTRILWTTASFAIAMALMYAPVFAQLAFLTALAPLAPWIMMIGCAWSVGLTVYELVMNQGEDIAHAKAQLVSIEEKLTKVTALLEGKGLSHNQRSLALLEQQRLEQEKAYIEQKIGCQRYKQVYAATMLTLLPIVLFAALMMPTTAAMVGIVVAFSVIAYLVHKQIQSVEAKAMGNESIQLATDDAPKGEEKAGADKTPASWGQFSLFSPAEADRRADEASHPLVAAV